MELYQKAVEQCEENNMIKTKTLGSLEQKRIEKQRNWERQEKANREENVEVLVCSNQWNTHNCAFNF